MVRNPLPTSSAAGASLRELMDRMGHSSPRAALIYLHGSDARQQAIADGLSRLVEGELQGPGSKPSKGARRARSGTPGDASGAGNQERKT
jgi:hypothetical protein